MAELEPRDLEALRISLRHRLTPQFLECMDERSAFLALDAALAQELDRLNDHEFASTFAASIGLASATDYLPRILRVGGAPLLCGIRFYNGNPQQPFVDLLAGEALEDGMVDAAIAAMRAFEVFRPTRARIVVPGTQRPNLPTGWAAELDQVLAVAPVKKVAKVERRPDHHVSIAPAACDEASAFVRAGYKQLAANDPALALRVFAATEDQLEECRSHGHLWWWTMNGERAGLIAARPDAVLGVTGLLMVEELIDARWAGLGSAAMAQREVARRVATSAPGTLMLGTIDATNLASRATARHASRTEIAAWYFLTCPALQENR